jgi:UDP-N-acetylmuramoylalanine--D-glutamate ligase
VRPGFDLEGKRVLVVGLARTGVATALFCAGYGAIVTATDIKPEEELREVDGKLRAAGVTLALGPNAPVDLTGLDLIVVSPGVPAKIPLLEMARSQGIAVWSEIELAWRFLRGRLIAITGSNGKTTTTSLVAHILKTANIPTLVGGNIGTPLIARVESSTDSTVTVAEISSFQLETIEAFRPEIGVLLNLTPDHLDRHESFEQYAAAKIRMFENQIERDFAILNADDPEVTRRMPSRPHIYWFSRQKRVAQGAFLLEDQIIFRQDGSETFLLRREDIPLKGDHNVENVLAACAASYLAGADPASIASGVKTFKGVEHRLEFVAQINGVTFYNDSKATNVDATVKAIESFPGSLIVILGGKDKGTGYAELREPLRQRARLVLLIGAAAQKIASQLEGAVPIEHAGTIGRAVELAAERAKPGDVVLLAPACASFDQFENFEHRGRVFKELVRKLQCESANNAPRTAAAEIPFEKGANDAP